MTTPNTRYPGFPDYGPEDGPMYPCHGPAWTPAAPATNGAYYTLRALMADTAATGLYYTPRAVAEYIADDLAHSAADALSRADVALRRGQACRVDATDAELREAANMMAEAMNRLRTERRRVVGILISRWTVPQ